MSNLILMYVYYDKNGDIKAITPAPDTELSLSFSVITAALSEVELFLKGKKNPYDFHIRKIEKDGKVSYGIVRKQTNLAISFIRTLDNYLTKINETLDEKAIVYIVNKIKYKTIELHINEIFKDQCVNNSTNNPSDTEFIRQGQLHLYFTKKNDPYYLLYSVSFHTNALFNDEILCFNYGDIDLSTCSVYTKRLVNNYCYQYSDN